MSDIITGYWLTRFISSIINENHSTSSSSSSSSSQSYKFIISGQRLDTSPELQSALQYFQGNDINCLLPIEEIISRFLALGSSKSPNFFNSSPPGQFIAEWNRYKASVFPRGGHHHHHHHHSKIQPETITLLTLFNNEAWHQSNQRREDYSYLGGNSSHQHRGVKRKAETLEDDVLMIMELCTVETELELLIDFARNVDRAATKLESDMKERISDTETIMTKTYSLATHDEEWCKEQIKKKFDAQLDGIRGQLTELLTRPQSSVLDNLVKKGYETKYKETKRAMEETPAPILYENEQQSFPTLYQYHKYLIGIKMNELYIEFCNKININALIPFMQHESVPAFENIIHRYHGGGGSVDNNTPIQLDSIKNYVDTEIKNKSGELKEAQQAIDELKVKPQLIAKFDQLQQYAILWDTHNNMCNTYQLISNYARPSGIISYAMDVIKSREKGELLIEKSEVVNNHIRLSNSFLIQSIRYAVPVVSEWLNQVLGIFNLFVTSLRSTIENMKSIITNKKLIMNQTIFTWKQMVIGSHNQSSMKLLLELLSTESSSSSTGAVDLLRELKESKIQSPRTVASVWNIIYTCIKLNIQSMTTTASSTTKDGQQFNILDSFQSKASRIE